MPSMNCPKAGFLNLGAADIQGSSLSGGGVLGTVGAKQQSRPHPLDARSSPHVTTTDVPGHHSVSPGGHNCPSVRERTLPTSLPPALPSVPAGAAAQGWEDPGWEDPGSPCLPGWAPLAGGRPGSACPVAARPKKIGLTRRSWPR